MRIDKYLASLWLVSRRQSKEIFKSWTILIGDEVIQNTGHLLHPWDIIGYDGETIPYKPIVVILLHKPVGYVCSDVAEGKYKSYRTLLDDCVYRDTLHVAGRLDADTTGLVLITNDGDLNHHIISPKKKMVKTYEVQLEKPIHDDAIKQLTAGVVLEDGYRTLPAHVIKTGEKKIILMIHEGKYHQVKRMLEAVGNKVIWLHRTQIGKCILWDIPEGKRKEIEESEIF